MGRIKGIKNPLTHRKDFDVSKIKGYIEGEDIYGYIYKTIFPNGKVYIGQSKIKLNSPNEKIYFGSGIIFFKALKGFTKYNLEKTILRLCYSVSECNKWEERFIKIFKSTDINYGYNVLCGSPKDSKFIPCKLESVAKKMRESKKGKNIGKNNPNYGNGDKIKGENNPMYDYDWTIEQRKNMSEKHILFNKTEKGLKLIKDRADKIRSRIHINNGKIGKMVSVESYNEKWVKKGFKKGLLNGDFYWVTNDVDTNLKIYNNGPIPEGFRKGVVEFNNMNKYKK